MKEVYECNLNEMKLIENELEQLIKIKHPNIVECFGSSNIGSKFLMIMEYIDGGNIIFILIKYNFLN